MTQDASNAVDFFEDQFGLDSGGDEQREGEGLFVEVHARSVALRIRGGPYCDKDTR